VPSNHPIISPREGWVSFVRFESIF
jgi:hypothetical protein